MSIYGPGSSNIERDVPVAGTASNDEATMRRLERGVAQSHTVLTRSVAKMVKLQARKPIITVWAEERGSLTEGAYEYSFGANSSNRYGGYTMAVPGTIFRMLICSVNFRGHAAAKVRVNIVLNGVEQNSGITKHAGQRSGFTIFDDDTSIKVPTGSVINFVTKSADQSTSSTIVTLLIELDLYDE